MSSYGLHTNQQVLQRLKICGKVIIRTTNQSNALLYTLLATRGIVCLGPKTPRGQLVITHETPLIGNIRLDVVNL